MHGKANIGAAPLVASLAPVIAGLLASAALAVDYLQPTPVFCSEGGGCEAVRKQCSPRRWGCRCPSWASSAF